MKKGETKVIIPLSEYNTLLETKEMFETKFYDNVSIVLSTYDYKLFLINPKHKHFIVTNDELSKELSAKIKRMQTVIDQQNKDYIELERKLNKRKRWWKI